MMAQNILINKNKILTSCYNIVLYICMRFQNIIVIFIYVISNQILQFIFYLVLSTIYIKLYIILQKYIYISKKITNLNANKNLIKIKYIRIKYYS